MNLHYPIICACGYKEMSPISKFITQSQCGHFSFFYYNCFDLENNSTDIDSFNVIYISLNEHIITFDTLHKKINMSKIDYNPQTIKINYNNEILNLNEILTRYNKLINLQ